MYIVYKHSVYVVCVNVVLLLVNYSTDYQHVLKLELEQNRYVSPVWLETLIFTHSDITYTHTHTEQSQGKGITANDNS